LLKRLSDLVLDVSIRSRRGGREKPPALSPCHVLRAVSIRSRRGGREKRRSRALDADEVLVSIRSRRGGREKLGRLHVVEGDGLVSIRSRRGGREKLRPAAGWFTSGGCFNPLPARWPGETPGRGQHPRPP